MSECMLIFPLPHNCKASCTFSFLVNSTLFSEHKIRLKKYSNTNKYINL